MQNPLQITPRGPQGHSPIATLRQYLTEIASGGAPFGPPPQGLIRRGHDDAPTPDVSAGAGVASQPWPDLPLAAGRTLPGAQVGKALLLLLCDEQIAGGGAGAGLTPDRLRGMLRAAGFDDSMIGRALPALARWLADAGVLADAGETAAPWGGPRRLATSDADEVARRLRETPPPTPEAVKAERARGLC